jgi:hypothetical protein
MTSTRRWNSYDNNNKHPDDSILLAYLRGQKLETRSSVIQHIENAKCSVCLQKLRELKQVSSTLDILGEMRAYQSYPELSSAAIYAHAQNAVYHQIPANTTLSGTNGRQRPRKSAMRLISIPVAFGLAILFTLTMFVFADLSVRTFNQFSSNGGTSSGQNIMTVAVPPHSTSTQQANVKVTAVVTPVTPVGVKQPYITVCSTTNNVAQLQLVICGFSFDSMHKAMLFFYVPGKSAFWLHNIPIDKLGNFHIMLNVVNCGNLPTFIFGYEATSSTLIKVKLHITSFGSCVAPTTPVTKP